MSTSYPRKLKAKWGCVLATKSESMHVESAVNRDCCAGCEVEISESNGGYGFADVFGLSPPADGGQAIGDQMVVFFFYGSCHVGLDDSRLDFIDGDAVFCEPVGK